MAAARGYVCDEAAGGTAALKLFRRRDYDLVVVDPICRQSSHASMKSQSPAMRGFGRWYKGASRARR
ncbi:MAG: hypothetical protein ABFC62_02685 [Clostridiaceae bacterium]